MKTDIKKELSMKIFNESIVQLHDDIKTAINKYFQRGHINPAVVIGLLEEQKQHTINFTKELHSKCNAEFQKKKPKVDYIG